MNDVTDIAEVVDATGLRCPEPIMMLHAAVRRVPAGALVQLLATDPSTQRDVSSFCRFLEHTLVDTREHHGRFEFTIRTASG